MDTSQLSKYAPAARRDFIAAVSAEAARLGITAKGNTPAELRGDVLIVGGGAFPATTAAARQKLVERVQAQGYAVTMEAIAYTWFNRFVAIRYMELHGYFDHGFRVLSHPEGQGRPEILDHAADVELPGLDRAKAVELKLDGTKDEELYRLLLKAQCNALHQAMPFLFEKIGDETELLLPTNLLHTDSLIRQLVESIDEDLWQEIEIIGWLYQFYISEKKDQVIGKVVKSEDIPAATQLFTPNWIVKYMVQNSLGAQWLATYPESPLKGQMEYYIEPAEQTEEVRAQLAAITPKALSPEDLTLIDPACGSGHILVEAYDLFKAIYLERGYRQRDVPQLILEKNLFGLDIDERAAQLTGFALMMKGRADDRRLFERGVRLNVMALMDSAGFDAEGLAKGVELGGYGLKPGDLAELKRLFEHATTFGSLIQVPEGLAEKLSALKQLSEATSQDMFVSEALKRLGPLVRQAELLAAEYDAVVANPPYMGSKGMNALVKDFARAEFPDARSDLFTCFIERSLEHVRESGRVSLVAPYVWMFLSSYETVRRKLVEQTTLSSLIQLEYNAFEPACIPVATFTTSRRHTSDFTGTYIRLSDFRGHQNQAPKTLEAIRNRNCRWLYTIRSEAFSKIPGSPLAYWSASSLGQLFDQNTNIDAVSDFTASQNITADNSRFLRRFWEVDVSELGEHWVGYSKGGTYRKWYGNFDFIVDWSDHARQFYKSNVTVHFRQ